MSRRPIRSWGGGVELAIVDGACLAVTGSELGLADAMARGEWEAIGRAADGERLVAGVVRVQASTSAG